MDESEEEISDEYRYESVDADDDDDDERELVMIASSIFVDALPMTYLWVRKICPEETKQRE